MNISMKNLLIIDIILNIRKWNVFLYSFALVIGESNSVSEVTSKLARNKRFYMNDKEEDLKLDFAKGTKKYETFEI